MTIASGRFSSCYCSHPCRAVPSNTLRDAHKPQKTRFGAAALGFSVTFAALHSQKTPRIGWCVNSNPFLPLSFPQRKTDLPKPKFYVIIIRTGKLRGKSGWRFARYILHRQSPSFYAQARAGESAARPFWRAAGI